MRSARSTMTNKWIHFPVHDLWFWNPIKPSLSYSFAPYRLLTLAQSVVMLDLRAICAMLVLVETNCTQTLDSSSLTMQHLLPFETSVLKAHNVILCIRTRAVTPGDPFIKFRCINIFFTANQWHMQVFLRLIVRLPLSTDRQLLLIRWLLKFRVCLPWIARWTFSGFCVRWWQVRCDYR